MGVPCCVNSSDFIPMTLGHVLAWTLHLYVLFPELVD